MRRIAWSAVSTVLALGVLTGCSSAGDKDGGAPQAVEASAGTAEEGVKPKASAKPTETARPKAAPKDGRIGDAGTTCVLPVSFEAPKEWKLTGVSDEDAELFRKVFGHPTLKGACELSARPTGVIGFIRVWTTDRPDASPRQVLEEFVAEEKGVSDPEYSELTLGGLPAVEVVYTQRSVLLDEPTRRRDIAVKAPKGVTVLHVDGVESEDAKVVIPGYELVKKTMRPAA
ncbi:lipoprotein [Streptomyces cinnamoneus]|uniref:lipoprotein n=1 Tax=Streptomyces cinnamoneus TaxID=53446 RepID=UPI0011B019ED|nr:lipoprotein [Streptomyces cinnamoneus]